MGVITPILTPAAPPSLVIEGSTLSGVCTITPPRPFEDARGHLAGIYKRLLYQESGVRQEFIQDRVTTSDVYSLRGLRGDGRGWRLISCLYGRSYLVAVSCDQESEQYGEWQSFIVSDQNHTQVLVPPKFAVGTLALSNQAITLEKRTAIHSSRDEFGVLWNDSTLNIWWPIASPSVSQDDQALPKVIRNDQT